MDCISRGNRDSLGNVIYLGAVVIGVHTSIVEYLYLGVAVFHEKRLESTEG